MHHVGLGTTERKKKIVQNLPENLKLISQKSRHSLRKKSVKKRNQTKINATRRKAFRKRKKKTKKVNRNIKLEEKSIISSKKSKSKQMPKSLTDIHLRGVYAPLMPSKHKK